MAGSRDERGFRSGEYISRIIQVHLFKWGVRIYLENWFFTSKDRTTIRLQERRNANQRDAEGRRLSGWSGGRTEVSKEETR
ncbi:hypothetical protein CesoFtcFv8_008296 [Champsocephalus esox]|uniref:Uncharacterized protein n=1 Tax=Champsocephalus esox TaxID=159716 RepID=A0AAN8H1T1_9TELE|nr:hypothetical protein CesoFtcFv8_008296 [Champsocephalus esox]